MRKDPSLQFNYTGLMSHPRKMELLEICTGVRTRKRQGGGKRHTAKPRQIKRLSEETCEKKDGDRQSHTDKKRERKRERDKRNKEREEGSSADRFKNQTARHTHTLNEKGRVPERHTRPNTERWEDTRKCRAPEGLMQSREEIHA